MPPSKPKPPSSSVQRRLTAAAELADALEFVMDQCAFRLMAGPVQGKCRRALQAWYAARTVDGAVQGELWPSAPGEGRKSVLQAIREAAQQIPNPNV